MAGPDLQENQYLPSEWSDNDRMVAMFKALPPEQQSAAREAKINFWTTAIHQWCRVTNRMTFTLQQGKQAFERNSQQPQCLPAVLKQMMQLESVCSLSSFNLATVGPPSSGETWTGWGVRLLAQPPRWAWNKLRSGDNTENLLQHQTLLDLCLLQEKASKLYNEFWKRNQTSATIATEDAITNASIRDPSRVRTLSELFRETGSIIGGIEELELCCKWLVQQRLAVMKEKDDQLYIAFAKPGQLISQGYSIPQTQIVELEMEVACSQLEQRVDELTMEAAELQQQAKMALQRTQRSQALSLLRRKKRAESSLKVQLAALDNATACAHQLADTRVNRVVISAFRSSALALKEMLTEDNSADGVADSMDELQQVLEECNDVSELLSGGSSATEDDSAQLEDELNSLLQQDNVDDVVNALDELTIPTDSPSKDTTNILKPLQNRELDQSAASIS